MLKPAEDASPAKSWARALELTAPIARHPQRTLPVVIGELADKYGDAPALLADSECLTFGGLRARSNQYARWAIDQGLGKGDVVALLMPNRPEYMAVWLGVSSVGAIVALLNTNLIGPSLAHCVNVVTPRCIIVDSSLQDRLDLASTSFSASTGVWVYGGSTSTGGHVRIDRQLDRYASGPLTPDERRPVTPVTIEDGALYIYTSGTTGLPKAAAISHARLMQWTHWFAGMVGVGPSDRMYNCLPMYHSVGGVLATGAVLVGGGSVAISAAFSARNFWRDIVERECTLFQYVGELCRYLLQSEVQPAELHHQIRMACGNGLALDVWERFKARFRIPRILEFYASTEGNVSLFNVSGQPGAVGRIPGFLRHRFPASLVRLDIDSAQPVRDERGFCIRCRPDEAGELIGPIDTDDRSNVGGRFEGYTSSEDTERKILRDVFARGDAWFRTGDLMRMDEQGSFYFVDRIGDTFRWKGENVSTTEVSAAMCEFPGIRHAVVYGVPVPGADGRAGMAAVVADDEVDLAALRRHLADRLPSYARPVFVRLLSEVAVTATFKHSKVDLAREAFDPTATADRIFLNLPTGDALIPLDADLFERIHRGTIRI